MTGFIVGLIIGLAVAAPVFAYLGYRYGSKAVTTAQAVESKAEQVKKEI